MMKENTLPKKVALFRQKYREADPAPSYIWWRHMCITLGIALIISLIAISQLSNISLYEWLTVPITFLYANLVEYYMHRWPMHRPIGKLKFIFRRHARQHHRFFTEESMPYDSTHDLRAVLFPYKQILMMFVFFGLPGWLLVAFLATTNAANLFIAVAFLYFINYELLHTAYHLPRDHWVFRIPFMKKLRQGHTDHHNQKLMTHYNFNVTYPISDLIFGTWYSEKSNQPNKSTNNTTSPLNDYQAGDKNISAS